MVQHLRQRQCTKVDPTQSSQLSQSLLPIPLPPPHPHPLVLFLFCTLTIPSSPFCPPWFYGYRLVPFVPSSTFQQYSLVSEPSRPLVFPTLDACLRVPFSRRCLETTTKFAKKTKSRPSVTATNLVAPLIDRPRAPALQTTSTTDSSRVNTLAPSLYSGGHDRIDRPPPGLRVSRRVYASGAD